MRRDIRNEYKVFPPKIRQNHQTSAMSFEEKMLFSRLQKYIGFSWASKRIFKYDLDFTDLTQHILSSSKHFVSNQSIIPWKVSKLRTIEWLDHDDDEEEDDGDDGGWSLLAGVCLKYTSLPSSTEVTCDREFVINTLLAFLDHYERF